MKRILVLIGICLLTAAGAWAENISFKVCSWDDAANRVVTKEQSENCILIEGESEEWKAIGTMGKTTYFAVKGNVKHKRLVLYGEVHLVLCDNATLTLSSGIWVSQNKQATLYIHSQSDGGNQGRLIAGSLYKGAAAIGGDKDEMAGAIYIHGGVVEATGAKCGAGIGGGWAVDNASTGSSSVHIYGGKVTAQGGDTGAGIGGGANPDSRNFSSASGEVYIFGGEVSATGGEMAAGVGGGGGYTRNVANKFRRGANGAAVYVYGGKLTAQGGYRGAGIGSGNEKYNNSRLNGGSLFVYGGTVSATGGDYGAGIGGGCNASGAAVEIFAGTVRAQGGKNSAGIGGGEDGKSGACTIHGGEVKAIAGEGCTGRSAGKGSAIGNGKGVSKDYGSDVLTIADNMMVTAGDHETNIERTFTAPERTAACQWRNYAQISPCTHKEASYVIIDGEKHRRNCTYCAANQDEAHDFGQAGNRHDCVCGQKFDSETTVLTLTRYFITYDGSKPSIGTVTEKIARGKGYILPAPPAINGLIFKGYSTTATTTGEMLDSEEGTLIAAGTVTLTDNTTYYARYRYDFHPEWTWNDECTEAKVTITNSALNGSETLTATCQLVDDQKPTDNQLGRMTYKATATYNRKTGITYTFTDEQVLEYFYKTEFTLDANADGNETIVEQYQDRTADVTIRNITLRKDGKLHSLCLPFSAEIKGSPLEGATIYSAASETIVDGQLQMTFKPVTEGRIESGEPYFVKWPQGTNIENPTFTNVFVGDGSTSVQDQYYELGGTFDKLVFNAGDKVLALEASELKALPGNTAGAFTNYLFIPREKNAEGEIAVISVRLAFEGDVTVEAKLYDPWEGSGTAESPYLIRTARQLQQMAIAFNGSDAASVNGKYFRQAANITFDKTKENNYTPVKKFMAHYDGAGYVISGLNIAPAGLTESAALFDRMDQGATVKNVVIQNSLFKCFDSPAAIAGGVQGGSTVENCHVLKDVVIESSGVAGGIVADLKADNSKVSGCTSQASVKGGNRVGGIVGYLIAGTVADCIYLGTSVNGNLGVNAVIGLRDNGQVTNSYFTAPNLTDDYSTLMPMEPDENEKFYSLLQKRDEFLLGNSGLTKNQIGYDLTMNGRPFQAAQNADGTWKSKAFTMCSPFDIDLTKMDNAEDIQVYKLHEVDVDNKVLQFTNEFPILKAGEPYVVVVNKGIFTLKGSNIVVAATPMEPHAVNNADGSKQMGWWTGTFKRMDNNKMLSEKAYILQRNGTFRCSAEKYSYMYIYPFRGYFSSLESLNFETFQVKYIHTENGEEDGDVTDFPADEYDSDGDFGDEAGISATLNDKGQMNNGIYDLQGRKLSGEPVKGVYIYNGKKVVK